jgi:acyl-CoA synthetase (AMP-forming)/AMP-acid ligase II
MGIRPGDRVATLAMNGYRHFELYYAISGIGAVCHTINPRLAPDQLAYIVNHASDRILFFDTPFAPLIAKMRPHFRRLCAMWRSRIMRMRPRSRRRGRRLRRPPRRPP